MKNLLFTAFCIALTVVISCQKEAQDTPQDVSSISLVEEQGYFYQDTTIVAGNSFKIKWAAQSYQGNFKYITILLNNLPLEDWNKINISASTNNGAYSAEANLKAPLIRGRYNYEVILEDADGKSVKKSIVLNVITELSVKLIRDNGYLYKDTVISNGFLKLKWEAIKGEQPLKFFTISLDNTPLAQWNNVIIPENNSEKFISEASFNAPDPEEEGVTHKYTITVFDAQNKSSKIDLLVTFSPPSINIINTPEYLYKDTVIAHGGNYKIKWSSKSGGSNFESYTVSINDLSMPNLRNIYIPIQNGTFSTESTLDIPDVNGTYAINITVQFNDGLAFSRYITVKITEGHENKLYEMTMGALASMYGSSSSASNGNVYIYSNASSNSNLIDFMYFYNSSAQYAAEIISPYYASINHPTLLNVSAWNTKNNTQFAKITTLSSAEFDAISTSNYNQIANIISGLTWNSEERISNLQVNDIFAFKTASGNTGLAKVITLNVGTAGNIRLILKVRI